jgi:hypothetical protein
MPQISYFFGISIRMFFDEHNPPHFHAYYGEDDCSINIQTLTIMDGILHPRAFGLVIEWAIIHKEELMRNWKNMEENKSLVKIEPLK